MSNTQVAIDAVTKLFEATAIIKDLLGVLNPDMDGAYFVRAEDEDVIESARKFVEE